MTSATLRPTPTATDYTDAFTRREEEQTPTARDYTHVFKGRLEEEEEEEEEEEKQTPTATNYTDTDHKSLLRPALGLKKGGEGGGEEEGGGGGVFYSLEHSIEAAKEGPTGDDVTDDDKIAHACIDSFTPPRLKRAIWC